MYIIIIIIIIVQNKIVDIVGSGRPDVTFAGGHGTNVHKLIQCTELKYKKLCKINRAFENKLLLFNVFF